MARSFFIVMVVASLLLSSIMAAKSPATSPIPIPHQKSSLHLLAVSPSAKMLMASPSTGVSPSFGSPAGAPSSFSTPTSGALGPAQNAAVLNTFTVIASAAVVIFSATLLM